VTILAFRNALGLDGSPGGTQSGAVRFDAATDAYTSSVVPSGAFTGTCWVQLVSDLNYYSPVWGVFNGTGVYRYIATDADGTTLTFFGQGGSGSNVTGPNMVVGTWYRVGLVVNGGDVTMYYGTETGTLTTATGKAGTAAVNQFRIGGSTFTDESLNGRIAPVKLWEAVLTPEEIVAELAQRKPVRTANLHRDHRWQIAETTDYSGNGNHLTAGSTATTTEEGPPIPDEVNPGVSHGAFFQFFP
jgi:hypothetical protein